MATMDKLGGSQQELRLGGANTETYNSRSSTTVDRGTTNLSRSINSIMAGTRDLSRRYMVDSAVEKNREQKLNKDIAQSIALSNSAKLSTFIKDQEAYIDNGSLERTDAMKRVADYSNRLKLENEDGLSDEAKLAYDRTYTTPAIKTVNSKSIKWADEQRQIDEQVLVESVKKNINTIDEISTNQIQALKDRLERASIKSEWVDVEVLKSKNNKWLTDRKNNSRYWLTEDRSKELIEKHYSGLATLGEDGKLDYTTDRKDVREDIAKTLETYRHDLSIQKKSTEEQSDAYVSAIISSVGKSITPEQANRTFEENGVKLTPAQNVKLTTAGSLFYQNGKDKYFKALSSNPLKENLTDTYNAMSTEDMNKVLNIQTAQILNLDAKNFGIATKQLAGIGNDRLLSRVAMSVKDRLNSSNGQNAYEVFIKSQELLKQPSVLLQMTDGMNADNKGIFFTKLALMKSAMNMDDKVSPLTGEMQIALSGVDSITPNASAKEAYMLNENYSKVVEDILSYPVEWRRDIQNMTDALMSINRPDLIKNTIASYTSKLSALYDGGKIELTQDERTSMKNKNFLIDEFSYAASITASASNPDIDPSVLEAIKNGNYSAISSSSGIPREKIFTVYDDNENVIAANLAMTVDNITNRKNLKSNIEKYNKIIINEDKESTYVVGSRNPSGINLNSKQAATINTFYANNEYTPAVGEVITKKVDNLNMVQKYVVMLGEAGKQIGDYKDEVFTAIKSILESKGIDKKENTPLIKKEEDIIKEEVEVQQASILKDKSILIENIIHDLNSTVQNKEEHDSPLKTGQTTEEFKKDLGLSAIEVNKMKEYSKDGKVTEKDIEEIIELLSDTSPAKARKLAKMNMDRTIMIANMTDNAFEIFRKKEIRNYSNKMNYYGRH